jgi:hypothetical protein
MTTPVIFVHAIAQEHDAKTLGERGLKTSEAGTSEFGEFSGGEPRLKITAHGYLVIAGTDDPLTSERILIFRKRGTRERAAALVRVRIVCSIARTMSKRWKPRILGPIPRAVVQWVREVDCGTDGHDIIMS